jgi:hypothetical protein
MLDANLPLHEMRSYQTNRDDKDQAQCKYTAHILRDRTSSRDYLKVNDRGSRDAEKAKIGGVSGFRAFTPNAGPKSNR